MKVTAPQELANEAKQLYQGKTYLEAARMFQAAAEGYLAAGDKLTSAEMMNNCSVAYLQGGCPAEAYQAVLGTDTLYASANDLRRQGIALGNLAAALEGLNRLDDAIQAYESSAEVLKKAGETELRAHSMQALSALLLKQGKQYEAVAVMQSGLAGIKRPSLKQRLLKKLLDLPGRQIPGKQ